MIKGKTSDDLSFIVSKLNELFGRNYNIVSFDELASDPKDLLQVLNDVIAFLDPEKHTMDISQEKPEKTFNRMRFFLFHILGMKNIENPAVEVGLKNGTKQIIYSILHNILEQIPTFQTKVYLSRYLLEIKVPQDMLQYPEVGTEYTKYKQLIQDFKEIHQGFTQLKEGYASPEELKKEILEMQKEKDQLKLKIDDQNKKIPQTEEREKLLRLAGELRKELEEKKKLEESKKEQEQQLINFRNRLAETKDKEIAIKKVLDRERDAQKKEIEDVQSKIKPETQDLEASSDGSKTMTYQKQVNIIKNKKFELEQKLAKSKETFSKLEEKLKITEKELEKYSGERIPTKEEFAQFKKDMINKANQAKGMKEELSEYKSEISILKRTIEKLKEKHEGVEKILDEAEAQHGVLGFRKVQEGIEEVSKTKSEIDEMKNMKLEELSQVVVKITDEITKKKEILGPVVENLKILKNEKKTIEEEYVERKAAYKNIAISFESEKSKLIEEIEDSEAKVRQFESIYQLLNQEIRMGEQLMARIEKEKTFQKGTKKFSEEFATRQAMLDAKAKELDAQNKVFRDRKNEISKNFDNSLNQIQMFQHLKQLLECKINISRNPRSSLTDMQNIPPPSAEGVDRLVVE